MSEEQKIKGLTLCPNPQCQVILAEQWQQCGVCGQKRAAGSSYELSPELLEAIGSLTEALINACEPLPDGERPVLVFYRHFLGRIILEMKHAPSGCMVAAVGVKEDFLPLLIRNARETLEKRVLLNTEKAKEGGAR